MASPTEICTADVGGLESSRSLTDPDKEAKAWCTNCVNWSNRNQTTLRTLQGPQLLKLFYQPIDSQCPLCKLFTSVKTARQNAWHQRHLQRKGSRTGPLFMCFPPVFSPEQSEYPEIVRFMGSADAFNILAQILPLKIQDSPTGLLSYFRQLSKARPDYESIKLWIKYCQDHHSGACKLNDTIAQRFKKFRLIDCQVDPPRLIRSDLNVHYYALSYVWGKDQESQGPVPYPQLPETLPNVVADAIKVTTALGGRYLWIDRYCIPTSKKENAQQINSMDTIYAGAELTIIAAAGRDSSYGLPGVTTRQRIEQPSATIKGETYISTMSDPTQLIKDSVWWTRGWCFQEGTLSRRRLVFTDEQVYFECQGMNCCEALYRPLDHVHVSDRSKMQDKYHSKAVFGYSGVWKEDADVFNIAYAMISTYSSKSLTRSGDGLRAIEGVLHMLQRRSSNFHHYAGIPIDDQNVNISFLKGLLWKPAGQRRGLIQRREKSVVVDQNGTVIEECHFPSWSWLGFIGRIEYDYIGDVADKKIQIRVCVKENETMDLDSFVRKRRLDYPPFIKGGGAIYLYVKTAFVQIVFTEHEADPQYWARIDRIHIEGAQFFRCHRISINWNTLDSGRLPDAAHAALLGAPLKCMIMGQNPEYEFAAGKAIVLWIRGGARERIGIFDYGPKAVIMDASNRIVPHLHRRQPWRMYSKREWLRIV